MRFTSVCWVAPPVPHHNSLSYTTFTYVPLPGDPHQQSPAARRHHGDGAGGALHSVVDLAGVRAALADGAAAPVGHIVAGLKAAAASYWVNVTNTGAVDSDDVVLGFLVPPGAGTNGTPLQQLFGFEVRAYPRRVSAASSAAVRFRVARHVARALGVRDRACVQAMVSSRACRESQDSHCSPRPTRCATHATPPPSTNRRQRVHIRAGQTVTVYLAANGASFTQPLADGRRVVWPGEYTVRFGVQETAAHGMGFAEIALLAR